MVMTKPTPATMADADAGGAPSLAGFHCMSCR